MHSLHFPLFRVWPAVLLLASWLGFTPGRAVAECGDYITIRNAPPGSTHHNSTRTGDTQTNNQPLSDGLEIPSPNKRPCHGPNCSSSPVRDHPPVAPIVPISTRMKESAQPLPSVQDESTTGSSFDRDRSSPHPIHRASSVFHPPRLV